MEQLRLCELLRCLFKGHSCKWQDSGVHLDSLTRELHLLILWSSSHSSDMGIWNSSHHDLPLTPHRAFNWTSTQSDCLNFPLATNVPDENDWLGFNVIMCRQLGMDRFAIWKASLSFCLCECIPIHNRVPASSILFVKLHPNETFVVIK